MVVFWSSMIQIIHSVNPDHATPYKYIILFENKTIYNKIHMKTNEKQQIDLTHIGLLIIEN